METKILKHNIIYNCSPKMKHLGINPIKQKFTILHVLHPPCTIPQVPPSTLLSSPSWFFNCCVSVHYTPEWIKEPARRGQKSGRGDHTHTQGLSQIVSVTIPVGKHPCGVTLLLPWRRRERGGSSVRRLRFRSTTRLR